MQRKTAAPGEEQERKEGRVSQSEVSQVPLREGKVGCKQAEMGALRRKSSGSWGVSLWLHMEAIREDTTPGREKGEDRVLFSADHVEK